ncbi:hypothetical protein IKN40_02475 [bacterium]|nr:hypothetical protein [bacterium]
MLFEVNSFSVAKNIDYVIQRDSFREPDLVVILPKDETPLPVMIHGNDWKAVDYFVLVDFDKTSIEKYNTLNAVIISVRLNEITIIDLSGYAILELKCEYREAVEYLEYLFKEAY